MKHQTKPGFYKLSLTVTLGILISTNQSILAQLKPEHTLGQENSVVKPIDAVKDRIEGGAIRGVNLFHSFQEFNIDTDRSIYFANPIGVENILTRVTGSNPSHILGTLGVEGIANLFLINPNGIFFGNNASLDIRGSFTATTADSIKLGAEGLFSAIEPANSNLLTVQPSALFANAWKNQQAAIHNRGNLTVDHSKNINLFSANVTNTGTLTAPAGNVQLTGAKNLIVRGNIEASQLLLNTENLTIAEDRPENTNVTIHKTKLEELSGNTNIILEANNDITIHPLSNNTLSLAHGSGKITFTADNDGNGSGNFQMSTNNNIKTNGRNISISGANLTLGNIDTSFVHIIDIPVVDVDPTDITTPNVTLDIQDSHSPEDILNPEPIEPPIISIGDSDSGAITLNATNGNINTGNLNTTSLTGTGGKINLSATKNIHLNNSLVQAGDDLTLQAHDLISINNSVLSTVISGNRNAGSISIKSNLLNVLNKSFLDASTLGNGDGGNIIIKTTGAVIFDNNSSATSLLGAEGKGNAGSISITSQSFALLNASSLSANTFGKGNAGSVTINATDAITFDGQSFTTSRVQAGATGNAADVSIISNSFDVLNGSFLSASTFGNGNAGSVNINATNAITFDNKSSAASQVGLGATGNAGGVSITTNSLELFNGSFLDASTLGNGNAGSVNIQATGAVKFDSSDSTNRTSAASQVRSGAIGNAGGVSITAKSLDVLNGSFLSTSTFGNGNAGSVTINATDAVTFAGENSAAASRVRQGAIGNAGDIKISTNSLTLNGTNTRLFANTQLDSTGNSGSIDIDAKTLIIKNGASIEVDSQGNGKGGDILLQADTLSLSDQAFITAKTISNNVGNINLNIQDLLLLRNNSQITTTAGTDGAGGDGGNININSPFTIAFANENSDITANAFQGNGGQINITTNAIFGLEVRSELTPKSDITASSQFGLAGDVQINTPDVDPTSGLIELSGNLVDVESLIGKDICSSEQLAMGSSFTITGKGGLPSEAEELISNSPGIVEWLHRPKKQEIIPTITRQQTKINNQQANNNAVIQEAQGWVITNDGKIILTAETPKLTLQNSSLNPPHCYTYSAK
ncbi:filamentous hemagglutinin N-terminal domain-containing protein [Anabaena sp. UHCC 0451]|uniref:two-partner secretion domain-containing protein n=1 Tax=Anabaena sp. UHCC 0451 TaxID=2055235 RepID=UPI002B1FEF1C|nr:filamentous hemagglutinin N-terminal domain-containing protein [Anabaena sp. UHCC 0451]MEA5575510.1 filamentous hemagglutinin N-terminal domain-containing protein [Anabaena sp. UHCC 0451]